MPSLPVRLSFDQGAQITSMAGYSLIYNTLDNNRNPTTGIRAELKQEFAGIGGDVNFIRSSGDARFYHEVVPDYVAMLRFQAGNITPWNGNDLRFNDLYQGGPNLVRGFRQNGFGPRDLTPWTTQDAIGGTNFWAASVELFIPLHFIPKDVGIRGLDLCRCRLGLGLQRADQRPGRSDDLRGFQAHSYVRSAPV